MNRLWEIVVTGRFASKRHTAQQSTAQLSGVDGVAVVPEVNCELCSSSEKEI